VARKAAGFEGRPPIELSTASFRRPTEQLQLL
jgi:hypothetical protein